MRFAVDREVPNYYVHQASTSFAEQNTSKHRASACIECLAGAAPAAWTDRLRLTGWEQAAAMPWIIPPPISSCRQLAHALLQQHGVTPGRVVEADQETVIASLVVSGVGMALMREEVAYEKAAAGEVCIWNDEQISTMLWFITQRQRENDPVIHALNEMQRELWAR